MEMRPTPAEVKEYGGGTAPASKEAAARYERYIELRLHQLDPTAQKVWVNEGGIDCEVATLINNRRTPYKDPAAALTAIRGNRGGRQQLGVLNKMRLVAEEIRIALNSN